MRFYAFENGFIGLAVLRTDGKNLTQKSNYGHKNCSQTDAIDKQ